MITDKKRLANILKELSTPRFSKSKLANDIGIEFTAFSRAINHPEKHMSANMIIKFNEFLEKLNNPQAS